MVMIERFKLKRLLHAYIMTILFLLPTHGQTKEVLHTLPTGIIAKAEYQRGDVKKPVVLILHGFLTTHNFNTIYRITNELASSNYSVLAPTLTLGIDKRSSGMACEAIHTHSMDDDLKEIDWWIDWLKKQGHKEIILIGHSTGSIELVVYNSRNPDSSVKGVITTGLLSLSQRDPATVKIINKDIQIAKKLVKNNDKSLRKYKISFCDSNFTSPAKQYLSYISWSGDKLIDSAKKAKTPLYSIIAGHDLTFRKSWANELAQSGVKIKVIKNAGHFFDAESEFDFIDTIQDQIKSIMSE